MTLSTRIAALDAPDNSMDVLCEVALFEPCDLFASCRANNAGTKVIYTTTKGRDNTHWAMEWTDDKHRAGTIAALKARGL